MTTLKLAVQKSGRLSEKSLQLLRQCGIAISNGDRKLKTQSSNFPLEVLFLRDDDIPQYTESGIAHAGILGCNEVDEQGKKVEIVCSLGFAKCRLSLAIPREKEYTDITYFDGYRIATSYPRILSQYLEKKGVSAEVEEISGSVELAPGIGLAEGICDIVSTGSTLLSNGLKEVETIMESEAVLIAQPNLPKPERAILKELQFRIQSVLAAQSYKYILLNAPNEAIPAISRLIPGMKSPTVLPLSEPGWSSLHSVVAEDAFWEVITELKTLGAQGILVSPIEKMIN